MAGLGHEEALFRRLVEHKVVTKRPQKGFVAENGIDVDGFVDYSISVHNCRKSRVGHSLEYYAEAVFRARNASFDRGPKTERNNRPDFLFPSIEEYKAASKGCRNLVMLGTKSSCKDRWRQVLKEAEKIPDKHLLTLELGITPSQTDQMADAKIQSAVLRTIHDSYTLDQQGWLLNVQ